MDKIPVEQAQAEVSAWLDAKKISEKKREKYRDNIETLIDAISEGVLAYDSTDNSFSQTLKFPIKGETSQITTLKYQPRVAVKSIQLQMQGVKSTDLQGMVIAYACALTGQVRGVISSLDTEDYSIASGIAIFFI